MIGDLSGEDVQKKIKTQLISEQGARLRAVREALGYNQGEMASALSVAQSYWSYVERGKRDISKNMIDKLVYQFDASVQFIYLGMGSPIGNFPSTKKEPIIIDVALDEAHKELDRWFRSILYVINLRIKHLGDDKEYNSYLEKIILQVSLYADRSDPKKMKEQFENYPKVREAFINDFLELFENFYLDLDSIPLLKRKFLAPKNVVGL